ncbi:MAG: hypothetical protein JWP75_1234 [Frondihabitans sp.]|nr:hypothetical protein [Frondihabitans sp.]
MTTTAVRPAHRPYLVSVSAITRLSPSFVRITFAAASLSDFATDGLDQRIKIVLPHPQHDFAHFPFDGEWYTAWRTLPDSERNTIRTYTARAIRPARGEVDVDFVSHGEAGPASAWVERARVGDQLVIVGPDAQSGSSRVGVEWEPSGASTVLLAGDETSVPAVSAILEAMPQHSRGQVFLEVPSLDDVLPLSAPRSVDVRWLPRRDTARGTSLAHGQALVTAVREWTSRYLTADHHGLPVDVGTLAEVDVDHEILWEVPEGSSAGRDFYAWLAGEAQAIKTLRRFLVTEVGLDRGQVAFMGYWRLGKSEN